MMKLASCCAAAAALLALSGCGSDSSGKVLEEVRLSERAHHDAIAARDVYGATRSYADDATLILPEHGMVAGKDALNATYEDFIADPHFAIAIKEGPFWSSSSQDLAVTTYTAQVTMSGPDGKPVTYPVANQTVWEKVSGKGWWIASEYNTALPGAGNAPPLASAAP